MHRIFFSFSRDRIWRARKEAKLLEAFDVRDGGPSMWDEGMSPRGALCQSTGQKVSFLRECRSGCVLGRHSSDTVLGDFGETEGLDEML